MVKNNNDSVLFKEAYQGWSGKKVIVLGDFILDEFIYGTTDRVSREAPVVIVRYEKSEFLPGGGANAARNIVSLGGVAIAVGMVGKDENGRILKSGLREAGVSVRGLVAVADRRTTSKTRVMAGDYHAQRQQIIRIDRENSRQVTKIYEERVLRAFRREVLRADAVIMSDYQEGVFTGRVIKEAIDICKRRNIPVIADSRFRLDEFRGVTAATPNEMEAVSAAGLGLAGDKSVDMAAKKLIDQLSLSYLIVTRGKFGMSLYRPGKRKISVPVIGSDEATDVTGAGDTVAAVIGLAAADGRDMITAMRIANAAASVVVMKRGTAVASGEEITRVLEESNI